MPPRIDRGREWHVTLACCSTTPRPAPKRNRCGTSEQWAVGSGQWAEAESGIRNQEAVGSGSRQQQVGKSEGRRQVAENRSRKTRQTSFSRPNPILPRRFGSGGGAISWRIASKTIL